LEIPIPTGSFSPIIPEKGYLAKARKHRPNYLNLQLKQEGIDGGEKVESKSNSDYNIPL
jgi:hypothetical protein